MTNTSKIDNSCPGNHSFHSLAGVLVSSVSKCARSSIRECARQVRFAATSLVHINNTAVQTLPNCLQSHDFGRPPPCLVFRHMPSDRLKHVIS